MNRTTVVIAALSALCLTLIGCQNGPQETPTPAEEEAQEPTGVETTANQEDQAGPAEEMGEEQAAGEQVGQEVARVTVSQKEPYGDYLTDARGQSLYMFMADSKGQTTCFGACANAWPPLTTEAKPVAGEGAKEQMLGTIERKDGTMQVTYDGWPLYYYAPDQQPGDTKGQDVEGFGAEWYLIGPDGQKIEAEEEGEAS